MAHPAVERARATSVPRVRDLMTTEPIVAELPGARADALKLLLRHDVTGLPVVNARTRRLAGVVTRGDLLRRPGEEQLALLMTADPLTVGPDAGLPEAARLFHERRIHTLPVVEDGELVGVLSPTDVLRTFRDGSRTVDSFVRPAPAVHVGTPLRVVWEILRLNHANAAAVLDDGAEIAGIVADSDLFKLSRVEERVGRDALGNAVEDDAWMWDRITSLAPIYVSGSTVELPREPVSRVMTEDVETVFAQASAADAARKMSRRKVNQLPVVDANNRLVGMVTDLDLMGAVA